MARTTHRQPVGRKILFLALRDANVWPYHDEGRAKDGAQTVSRGQIENLVDKKVVVDGKTFPCFMLAEVPEALYPNDAFDEKVLKDRRGNWILAASDPEWMAQRKKFVAAAAERVERAKGVLETHVGREVVEGLAQLALNAGKAAAPPPSPSPPPTPKKGGAG